MLQNTIRSAVVATVVGSTLLIAPAAQAAETAKGGKSCKAGYVVEIVSYGSGKIYHQFAAPGERTRTIKVQNTGYTVPQNTITSLRKAYWKVTAKKSDSGGVDGPGKLSPPTGANCIKK